MPKRILLADDSVTIQKVVELTFAEGDYEVTSVSNGRAAIEKVKESRPDILLCDIIMPEVSGYEVAEFVKKNPAYAAIPVILLTGTFEPFDEEKARQSGADTYITKPFDSRMLVEKVESLLRGRLIMNADEGHGPVEIFTGQGRSMTMEGKLAENFAPAPGPLSSSQEAVFGAADFVPAGDAPAAPPAITPPEPPTFTGAGQPMPEVTAPPAEAPAFAASASPFESAASPFEAAPDAAPEPVAAAPSAPEVPEPEPATSPAPPAPAVMDVADFEPAVEPEAAFEPAAPPETPPSPEGTATPVFESHSPEPPALPDVEPSERDVAVEPEEPAVQAEAPASEAVPPLPPFAGDENAEPEVESYAGTFETPKLPAFVESQEPEPEVESTPWAEAEGAVETAETVDGLVHDMTDQQEMVAEAHQFDPAAAAAPPAAAVEPEPSEEAVPAEEEPLPTPEAAAPAASLAQVTPEQLEEVVRRVVAEMAPELVRQVAWEVIPELAESIIKRRIQELEAQVE